MILMKSNEVAKEHPWWLLHWYAIMLEEYFIAQTEDLSVFWHRMAIASCI